ncbi:kelch-like protein 10 [Scomber scombrus]|uniref:Kelch-like protein 10 n=1 Tax=Scomber scombrus TaxID=13677 RepID=A0AAV1Q2F2_SCOSC
MSTISNSVFSQVLLEGKLCDVVISVGNVEFQAHRIILCGCSSFFRNLFCTTPSEVYSFPDVPPNIMSLIMEYAYNSSVVVTEENVLGLLAAAHRFAIHGILSATSDFLEQKLCVENCIGTWMSAELYNCPDLRKKANLYILHHFEEVAGSSEKFLQLSVQQLAGLIKKDELNVRQESTVFEAILRWIDHNLEERKSHMAVLLSKIYICGGFNGEELLSSAECYNPQSNQWTMIASMGSGLNGAAVIAYKDLIYVVGGFNGVNCVNTVIAYDPVSHRWRAIPPMINSRSNFGIAVLEDQLYAVGGFENLGASHEVERYDGNSWKSVQRLNIPCSTPSCCVVERNPYFSTTINYQINFMKK